MFLGHYAVALGAKPFAPRTSLGTLAAAAVALDLIWPLLVLAGIERVRIVPGATAFTPLDFEFYPWSHSLLMALAWAALFGALYLAVRRDRCGALVVAALVASHWALDVLVHRPDLPLLPGGGVRIGLGLWNSVPASVALELGLFALGAWLYERASRARDTIGRRAWVALLAAALLIFAGNAFGPPPPDARAIAWTGLAQWLFVAWAAWIDHHRASAPVATA